MPTLSIHKKYKMEYPPEAVFDIWVSPNGVVAPVTAIKVEAQMGGLFKLTVDGDTPSHMIGTFIEFERPSKLIYTWEWNHDGEVSQVHVQFNPITDGTEVIIDHTDFNSEQSRATHDSGWDSYISGIRQLLENGK